MMCARSLTICFLVWACWACGESGQRAFPPDLDGRPVAFFQGGNRVAVLLFVSGDCPISRRYAPQIKSICRDSGDRGVDCWLVFPDRAETPESIRLHLDEFGYKIAAVHDPGRVLTAAAKATVTPEAAVFAPTPGGGRKLVYHGRIDDRYASFGKARPQARSHDLELAIQAVLEGAPIKNPYLRAVGCYIPNPKL